jgi:hypothetical protein
MATKDYSAYFPRFVFHGFTPKPYNCFDTKFARLTTFYDLRVSRKTYERHLAAAQALQNNKNPQHKHENELGSFSSHGIAQYAAKLPGGSRAQFIADPRLSFDRDFASFVAFVGWSSHPESITKHLRPAKEYDEEFEQYMKDPKNNSLRVFASRGGAQGGVNESLTFDQGFVGFAKRMPLNSGTKTKDKYLRQAIKERSMLEELKLAAPLVLETAAKMAAQRSMKEAGNFRRRHIISLAISSKLSRVKRHKLQ